MDKVELSRDENNELFFDTTKNKKSRTLPISTEIAGILHKHLTPKLTPRLARKAKIQHRNNSFCAG
jgi:hypothetical protein